MTEGGLEESEYVDLEVLRNRIISRIERAQRAADTLLLASRRDRGFERSLANHWGKIAAYEQVLLMIDQLATEEAPSVTTQIRSIPRVPGAPRILPHRPITSG
jgi:hypothetical protein